MVKVVDGRLEFERPLERPVLTPALARLLLALAERRIEERRARNGEEAA